MATPAVAPAPVASAWADAARHEVATVDEKRRLRLNGESRAQMRHALAIKAAGGVSLDPADGSDTSKDQAWSTDCSVPSILSDVYIMLTSGLWLVPKVLAFFIPLVILQLPAMLVVRCFGGCLTVGQDSVRRTPCFYLVFLLAWVAFLPCFALVLTSLALDYLLYWLFSIPYCFCACRWRATWRAMRKLDPYRNGPWLITHQADFFVAVVGQTCRQGLFEVNWMVALMWLVLPWVKYYINCNPWIHDLDHRMVQQISTGVEDVGVENAVDSARRIVCNAKVDPTVAEHVDLWSFVPHYPLPPPGRRYALGLQAAGRRYPKKFTLFVHTTHASCDHGGSSEQLVLSNSCLLPVWRVMLWYNNPYHFLTGWVEAQVSNGEPSQKDKRTGGEHPMWIVTSRTPLLSSRRSLLGVGSVDAFFDYWLPVYIHEIRYLHYEPTVGPEKALEIANSRYQEVHSQDGISRPLRHKVGLAKYKGDSALHDHGLHNP